MAKKPDPKPETDAPETPQTRTVSGADVYARLKTITGEYDRQFDVDATPARKRAAKEAWGAYSAKHADEIAAAIDDAEHLVSVFALSDPNSSIARNVAGELKRVKKL